MPAVGTLSPAKTRSWPLTWHFALAKPPPAVVLAPWMLLVITVVCDRGAAAGAAKCTLTSKADSSDTTASSARGSVITCHLRVLHEVLRMKPSQGFLFR
jgi:hypothetical protein